MGSAVALAFAILLGGGSSWADATPAERAAARALFDQGRDLADKGNYAEACAKFEESQRLQPGMGTLFNLANCNERVGKSATAWAQFLDVASQARASGQAERESAARERAQTLEKVLSRVTVAVPTAAVVEGFEVRLDTMEIHRASWNTPLPVDPGRHELRVSAPNHSPWSYTLEVPATGQNMNINVPQLERIPAAPIPALEPAATATRRAEERRPDPVVARDQGPESAAGTSRATIGWIVGGAGIALTGAGAYFAIDAKSDYDSVAGQCPVNVCSQGAYDQRTTARSQMRVASTVAGVGILGMAAGAWLVLSAPTSDEQARAHGTHVAVGPGAVMVKGRF